MRAKRISVLLHLVANTGTARRSLFRYLIRKKRPVGGWPKPERAKQQQDQ
jgi:hypothetical protein